MKQINTLALIVAIVVTTSCSMTFDKRLYRKGYHINIVGSVNKKSGDERLKADGDQIRMKKSDQFQLLPIVLQSDLKQTLIETVTINHHSVKSEKPVRNGILATSDCDVITLKNGTEIEAIIIKVGDEIIEYKKCSNQEGPLFSIKASEVLLIKFKNGENYVPQETRSTVKGETKTTSGGNSPVTNILSIVFAVLGLILAMLGLFIPGTFLGLLFLLLFGLLFGVAAIVLGARGQQKQLKGLGLGGLILGIVVAIASLIGLVILFILFF